MNTRTRQDESVDLIDKLGSFGYLAYSFDQTDLVRLIKDFSARIRKSAQAKLREEVANAVHAERLSFGDEIKRRSEHIATLERKLIELSNRLNLPKNGTDPLQHERERICLGIDSHFISNPSDPLRVVMKNLVMGKNEKDKSNG